MPIADWRLMGLPIGDCRLMGLPIGDWRLPIEVLRIWETGIRQSAIGNPINRPLAIYNRQLAIGNPINRQFGNRKLSEIGNSHESAGLESTNKSFALRVMKLVDALPKTVTGKAIGNQLVRAATGVGSNYRACCRARSRAEFIAKIGVVEEEADESAFWMELIIEGELLPLIKVEALLKEANELTAIMASSRISAKRGTQASERQSVIGIGK